MVRDSNDDRFQETRSARALSPGTQISHYRIIGKIGEGGMGIVYAATDTKLERKVAVKFLPSHLACDQQAKERFVQEAKAASALSHANITTIHEIDEADDHFFIVMEYVDGKTVRETIGEKDLSVEEVLEIAIQIGQGLDHAHKRGVFHRDIKSDNIKVAPDGTAKIMDFGLAKLKDATKVTKTGTTLGTLPYMSPEQVEGKDLDQRSDIFSLGVVLFEMITGRLPFTGDYEQGIIYAILNQTPEPLARYKTGLPAGLQHIVNKALAKDKRERYQHADELVADLMREKRLLESATTMATMPMRSPARRRLLRILLPVVAAAVAVLLIFVLEPFRVEMGPREEAAALENSLAVMYFENMPEPDDKDKIAQMITALLITDLSESEYMYVISRQRLYDILKLLGKEDLHVIDRTVASEVAREAGVRWMLTGSILQTQPSLVVTADISEVSTGKILATQRVAGVAGEDIFALVDRLSAAIKTDLTLPAAADDEPDRPVADVTTHSVEAYRHYLDGTDAGWKFYFDDARQSLKKALEYDSTFAMAYCRLGGLSGGEERLRYAEKGLEFADKASNREQYYLKGFYRYASRDYAGAREIMEEALLRYPDDKEILFTLGTIYEDGFHSFDRAIEHYTRAVEIDPMYKIAYNGLAYAYHYVGDFDRSIWAINKYIALAPDEANPYDSRGDLYAYSGKVDDAIMSYKEAVRIKPDFWGSMEKLGYLYLFRRQYQEAEGWFRRYSGSANSTTRSLARLDLALIPAHQGRFEEAIRLVNDGLAADRMDGYNGLYKALKQGLKSEIYTIKEEFDSAVAEVEVFCDMAKEAYPLDIVYYRPLHALRLARAGRFDEARQVAEGLRRDIEAAARPEVMSEYWNALAHIEMVGGNADSAVSHFEKAQEIDPTPHFHIDIRRGRAYLEAGRLAEAVAVLERALSRYDEERAFNPAFSVRTHYFLGRAYEASGWQEKAIAQYQLLLDTWKDADPGIPVVERTRQRLADLREAS